MNEEEFLKSMIKSVDMKIKPSNEIKKKIFDNLEYELSKSHVSYSIYTDYLIERILKLFIPITILVTVCTRISVV